MKDSVEVSVEFYYKGEHYTPSMKLDLGILMKQQGCLPDLSMMLARANDIGEYSYELEVMMMEPLHFDQAEGLAADYINDGVLDISGYEAAWHEKRLDVTIEDIARRILHMESLDNQADLKRALIEAYNLGKAAVIE